MSSYPLRQKTCANLLYLTRIVNTRLNCVQLYKCTQAPHHQTQKLLLCRISKCLIDIHRKKTATKNNLQCSQTSMDLKVPVPSVSPTTCREKSVLLHMILSVKTIRDSSSSKTCRLLSLSIAANKTSPTRFLCTISPCFKASYATSVILSRTSTASSSL